MPVKSFIPIVDEDTLVASVNDLVARYAFEGQSLTLKETLELPDLHFKEAFGREVHLIGRLLNCEEFKCLARENEQFKAFMLRISGLLDSSGGGI